MDKREVMAGEEPLISELVVHLLVIESLSQVVEEGVEGGIRTAVMGENPWVQRGELVTLEVEETAVVEGH